MLWAETPTAVGTFRGLQIPPYLQILDTVNIGMTDTFKCLNCAREQFVKKNTRNKFCNNSCQSEHQWKHETVPRIERGECTHNSKNVLKRYLVETVGEFCACCGLGATWNENPLTLQLDHIDGNSDNNVPSNLRLICPNCHSQTPTFGSKGKGSRYKKDTKRNSYLREYKGRMV